MVGFADQSRLLPAAWKHAAYEAVAEYMAVVETCIDPEAGELFELLAWWQQHAGDVGWNLSGES